MTGTRRSVRQRRGPRRPGCGEWQARVWGVAGQGVGSGSKQLTRAGDGALPT